ncbi:hypothetical protein HYDPIDRAFT_102349 [Hydnomerulius pinastri MD-312]|uniref:Uncharacterized protein n=1 Tax=Hydnomerulius pinastri MD-312 TaxID=994086 RepID=A0A0C9UZY2_9AGAM|nr:hypothetical protein HYDPIDRAFT_102349 [Hydnomerulius pinastri MD-312]
MSSAGEKQYYALALIQKLMDHLPSDMRVGLLYDIGCQLEQSCCKWNFFDEAVLLHFEFAISVFNAYGHQWPCQVIYHPRKREGFGLSDGKGCERLWSSLKPLIAPLRVSGYHQCLFVLDLQVRHLDVKSSTAFAHWLLCRWKLCQVRKKAAEVAMRVCRIPEAKLRTQWRAQVEQQTKPSPRTSNNRAVDKIARILELEEAVIARAREVSNLEMEMMLRPRSRTHDLTTDLEDAREQHCRLRNTVHRCREALGVSATASLANLRNNEYLCTSTNTLTLKACIRKCLQD